MKYNEFKEKFVEQLMSDFETLQQSQTPEGELCRDFKLKQDIQYKPNVILDSICIMPNDTSNAKIGAMLNVQGFYEDYNRINDFEALMKHSMASVLNAIKNLKGEGEGCDIRTFIADNAPLDAIRGKLDSGELIIIPYLVQTKGNEAYLENLAHREYLNLTITYRLLIADFKSDDSCATITISNALAEALGFSEETLYEVSIQNLQEARRPVSFPIYEVMGELLDMAGDEEKEVILAPFEETKDELNTLMVITNDVKQYGSSSLLLTEPFREIAERFKANLFILPSSIHELLALPDNDDRKAANSFLEMVVDVNATQVVPQERLSDAVYYYDYEKDEIELLCTADGSVASQEVV